MAIAFIDSDTSAASGNLSAGPVDMAGASLIVCAHVYYSLGTLTSGPDDGVNTYVPLPLREAPDNGVIRLYYAENPDVSSPLTVETVGSGVFNALIVAGFSGVKLSSAFDQNNDGATGGPTTSLQPGPTTPTEDNELLVTAIGLGGTISGLGINSGFSSPIHIPYQAATNFGLAFSYLVQSSAAEVNPLFSWTTSVEAAQSIATFRAGAGAVFVPQLLSVTQSNLRWR